MSCNNNIFDAVQEEIDRRMALANPGVALALAVGSALDTVLIGVGISTGLGITTDPTLDTELERSHQEYTDTATDQRTQTRLSCQTTTGGSGRGTRKPDEVEDIVNRNIDQITARVNALPNTDHQLLDAWKETLADIHNCIEEAITDGMVERKPPGERKYVTRRVRVCDRYEEPQ